MVKSYIVDNSNDLSISSVRSSEIAPKSPNDKKCAPSKNFEDGSCLTIELLVEIASAFNDYNKDKPIKLCKNAQILNPKKYKRYLVKRLQNRMKNVCSNQRCWIKQDFMHRIEKGIKKDLYKNTYRPHGPKGKFTWLNTLNINDVMEQYEKVYPDFKFLGAVPIDFAELPTLGINDENLEQLVKSGKKRLGVVFNLDEHYKSGSHWVASYCDISKGLVYFFDSYATEPEPRIRKLMRKFGRLCKQYGKKNPTVDVNSERHQYKNSECGVYSINFILRLLKGDTFEQIQSDKTPDDKINQCRDVYFIKKD